MFQSKFKQYFGETQQVDSKIQLCDIFISKEQFEKIVKTKTGISLKQRWPIF